MKVLSLNQGFFITLFQNNLTQSHLKPAGGNQAILRYSKNHVSVTEKWNRRKLSKSRIQKVSIKYLTILWNFPLLWYTNFLQFVNVNKDDGISGVTYFFHSGVLCCVLEVWICYQISPFVSSVPFMKNGNSLCRWPMKYFLPQSGLTRHQK